MLRDFERAFASEGADPNLSSVFVGARGTGKTALLTYLAKKAESKGWIAVSVSAKSGMLDEIYEQAYLNRSHLLDIEPKHKLKSLTVGQFVGAEWESDDGAKDSWRTKMNRLIDELESSGAGLLITVDEVNPSIDEMIELASTYQHFVREDRKVALLLAGLPNKISSLISSDSVSFLRRARNHRLKRVADPEIEIALKTTLSEGDRFIDEDALNKCVQAIEGFPYLLQLVGFYLWEGIPSGKVIREDDAAGAVKRAQADFEHGVLNSTYRELSSGDLAFLEAMLGDDGPSQIKDITGRIGKSSSHTRVYKHRLLEAGVIDEERRGEVRFELPMFKEYLKEKTGFDK